MNEQDPKYDKDKQGGSQQSSGSSAPVPSPPPSTPTPAAPTSTTPPVAEQGSGVGTTETEDIHEYRDVADGVKARVRTPEERAADAPDQDGLEVTTAPIPES